jgi:hypothetical protein
MIYISDLALMNQRLTQHEETFEKNMPSRRTLRLDYVLLLLDTQYEKMVLIFDKVMFALDEVKC